jgi:hypothetical protein
MTNMPDTLSFTITWKDMLDRGLNEKVMELHPQIEKYLKEICTEKYKNAFPKERFPIWHFVKIHFSSLTDTYFITIGKGLGAAKG